MLLKNIKLSGFKSFADVVTIPVRGHINAIVGPNGCGKSNVVDAIRWVIGESSAKQLRGQLMADVVFNGTNARKPVGKAAVELNFDNTDGRLVGEYAGFPEIAVRREVSRDGQSAYLINGTQCRRRDIIDIFLGTGLGPNSYAIIEQGMISRLIESKPDELRVYLEEAAGISKYRERRRETENRMRHTQENLDRLNDLREELDKQLKHLKRQANAAERYQELKQEERLLQAQIKALRWQTLADSQTHFDELINQKVLAHEAVVTAQREQETRIEKYKDEQVDLTEKQNTVQKAFYGLGAEIARIEQQIQNIQEQTQRWQKELNDVETAWQELTDNVAEQQEQIGELSSEIAQLQPQNIQIKESLKTSRQQLQHAEQVMQQNQDAWDHFQTEFSQGHQQAEVIKTKLEHATQQLMQLEQRMQQLTERTAAQPLEILHAEIQPLTANVQVGVEQLDEIKNKLEQTTQQIHDARQVQQQLQQELAQTRRELQSVEARSASLEALQQAALGINDENQQWLQEQQLAQKKRLGKAIRVKAGWELAVETVLSGSFDAICLDSIDAYIQQVAQLPTGHLTLIDKVGGAEMAASNKAPTLLSQIESEWPIQQWLTGIYIAENLAEAQKLRGQLSTQESVITKDGIWLGVNWIRISRASNSQSGILIREQELQHLQKSAQEWQEKLAQNENALQQNEQLLHELESAREQQHQIYRELSSDLTEKQMQLSGKQSRLQELQQQAQQLQQELVEQRQYYEDTKTAQEKLQAEAERYSHQLAQLNHKKAEILQQRDQARNVLDRNRQTVQAEQQKSDELEIRLSANENQLSLLNQTIGRSERQLTQLAERRDVLTENLNEVDGPQEKLATELQELLAKRMTIEQELFVVQNEYQAQQQGLKQLESERQQLQNKMNELQTELQDLRMERQGLQVRQTTLQEQIVEANFVLDTLLTEMPAEANIANWEQRAEALLQRINRLGPINLAAIDECQAVEERKVYLDKQHADLTEALCVLDEAIRKMDRETRAKFKETFEKVNEQFQMLFPKVFGGGKAYLELSEDDLLSAGVIVRAQPPGKRNATIHMLSGGEKALTAVALVFGLFHLNPAPFCILDEVDAPLDDLNVGRFCQLVKEMSKSIQFLVISHNKLTIEMADHLMGVTMQEAGVSRLVAVDMKQAIEMATV